MKRFASHYLLIPAVGYMKQQVVEITDEGVVRGVFPLTEEIESVEWMPGVIVLLSESQMEEIKNTGMILKNIPVFQINLPSVSNQSSSGWKRIYYRVPYTGENTGDEYEVEAESGVLTAVIIQSTQNYIFQVHSR